MYLDSVISWRIFWSLDLWSQLWFADLLIQLLICWIKDFQSDICWYCNYSVYYNLFLYPLDLLILSLTKLQQRLIVMFCWSYSYFNYQMKHKKQYEAQLWINNQVHKLQPSALPSNIMSNIFFAKWRNYPNKILISHKLVPKSFQEIKVTKMLKANIRK